MEDLSLHILDIVENSIAALADQIEIHISEDTKKDVLTLEIRDNGTGMDAETCERVLDPFYTTRTTRRVGLGLPLLAQAARQSGGDFALASKPEQGTTVTATFQLSHPDSKPLGDIAETLGTILTTQPDLDLRFEYRKDHELIARLDSSQPQEKESTNG